jgi:hypothetical protein
MDGIEQTDEVKSPFIIACVFARSDECWIIISLCPCSHRHYFRCSNPPQTADKQNPQGIDAYIPIV